MLVLFASGRAMNRFLEHVTDLRLMLLVQGDQPRYRLVELHRKRWKAASAACWWVCSPLPKVSI